MINEAIPPHLRKRLDALKNPPLPSFRPGTFFYRVATGDWFYPLKDNANGGMKGLIAKPSNLSGKIRGKLLTYNFSPVEKNQWVISKPDDEIFQMFQNELSGMLKEVIKRNTYTM